VLLSFVYYRCPMLCSLVLDGMTDSLKELEWTPGDRFQVINVSFDPTDTPELATAKKASYMEAYGRPGAEHGWHFLTGSEGQVRKLADAVGFGYRYLPADDEFAHAAALFVITPDGRVSRYLYGIRHDTRTVRLSLVETAAGEIGTAVDRFLLY
jgi:protein SCO1/2